MFAVKYGTNIQYGNILEVVSTVVAETNRIGFVNN